MSSQASRWLLPPDFPSPHHSVCLSSVNLIPGHFTPTSARVNFSNFNLAACPQGWSCCPGHRLSESEKVLTIFLSSQSLRHRRDHCTPEYATSAGNLPGGLKTMISSKSLDISCSKTGKAIFPFCSRALRNWTIWWVKAWHFGTMSWQKGEREKERSNDSKKEMLAEHSREHSMASGQIRKPQKTSFK